MGKGLFDLTNFNEMSEDDILKTNINEEAEFAKGSYATSSVDNGVKDATVSVPGGLKETPNAKPYDASSVTIPGGDAETPKAKPYDASSVANTQGVTLTDSQWKSMLSKFQNSFKESMELMEMLQNANLVHKTDEEMQIDYAESVVDNALVEAYSNGPIYEAVERNDKKTIKSIVTSIRKSIRAELGKYNVSFYEPAKFVRTLLGSLGNSLSDTIRDPEHSGKPVNIFSTYLWQILGAINCEGSQLKEIMSKIEETYKDELQGYKILYCKMPMTISDTLRVKFNWKNAKGAYFLIIDKKLTSELKNAVKSMADASKKNDDKSEPKTESYYYSTDGTDTTDDVVFDEAASFMEKCWKSMSKEDKEKMKKEDPEGYKKFKKKCCKKEDCDEDDD